VCAKLYRISSILVSLPLQRFLNGDQNPSFVQDCCPSTCLLSLEAVTAAVFPRGWRRSWLAREDKPKAVSQDYVVARVKTHREYFVG